MNLKEYLPKSVKSELSNWYKLLKGEVSVKEIKLSRLKRFTPGITDIIKPSINYVDSASFLSAYREIFIKEIYNFKCSNNPKIIDCGSNIGLAIIYWKRKYPKAKITGFEPDPFIFEVLNENINRQNYSDVNLYNKGVYFKDSTLKFHQDGADAGHLLDDSEEKNNDHYIEVSVLDLNKYLTQPIDMLKIDIEGAEADVISNCEKNLRNVKNLFVEYHSFINKEQRLEEIIMSLKKAGFRYHIYPELFSKQPFIDQLDDHNMDNRVNIFAYRK